MPTWSEFESKRLLAAHGVPVIEERLADDADGAVQAAKELGFPVVAKLCGAGIAHKTERGLVRLGLNDVDAVRRAADELLAAVRADDGDVGVLVGPMVRGARELIAGLHRDANYGPTVMLGLGGILAEAVGDAAFRLAPLARVDALEMIDDLSFQAVLGPFRGEPAVDRAALADVVIALAGLAAAEPDVVAIDINPLIVVDGRPIAVDALVEASGPSLSVKNGAIGTVADRKQDTKPAFDALFDPSGVVVAGASSHPGKFGFVALHNILRHGYGGRVLATNLEGGEVLGVPCARSVDELPPGAADLAFVCTPAAANLDVLRGCAEKGVRAVFVTSAGYAEAGEEGRRSEDDLVALAAELGLLLAGPNGQGVVSTPASLCAQIVAPYPPPGRIAIASQSGNFVSTFMNDAVQSEVGVSRAVSAGNAAAIGIPDYLEFFATDPATAVSLAYVESVPDGRTFFERTRGVTEHKPLVVLKGGTTAGGQRAAASHTGAMATDDRIFDGMCRQAGITRAASVDEAFEAAASFATQPLPKGPRTVVLTTAGGWGVVTADAITRSDLELVALPDDLRAAIDERLPARWSRNNPIDCAGGETRETIPELLELIAGHEGVDAVIYLGLGIQSNQARAMKSGQFYPDHGLERIVAFHERQDQRYAESAAAVSEATGKPILVATELAVAQPDNPGPAAVRASGRLCYSSSHRAVTALDHMWRYARWRTNRALLN